MDDRRNLYRTAQFTDPHMHVVVIGGGIVGTALAAKLGSRGVAVTLLEQDELGGGTTAASAAVFTWQQISPEHYDHYLRART